MIRFSPPKTMRDVTSSLVGSSFRRVQQDGRVTFARRIMTLAQLPPRTRPGLRP
jgi:hypothetical protein